MADENVQQSESKALVAPKPANMAYGSALSPMFGLPPEVRPKSKTIKKGDLFIVVDHELMDRPLWGRVIALTKEPGKTVGVEFDEPVLAGVNHDCDGRGKLEHCLWVRPDHLFTEDEYRGLMAARQSTAETKKELEVDTLTIESDPETGIPVAKEIQHAIPTGEPSYASNGKPKAEPVQPPA